MGYSDEQRDTATLRHELWNPKSVPVPFHRQPEAPAWMQLPAFRDLPESAIERLQSVMQRRTYLMDAPLMRQGEPGDGFYVLNSGRVRVAVCNERGEVVFQRTMEAPGVLGEAAVLTGESRSATVTADSHVEAFFIDGDTLRSLCAVYPPTAAFLTALAGDRLMASESIRKVGKYEVTGRLGAGGFATVFAAMHPQLQRPVALKMLSHALVADKAFIAHFVTEAQLVAQMDHPNIVRVYDTERAYGTQFIVMERLQGDVLKTPSDGGPMPSWANVRRILVQILDALAYSHSRGLIHRDIKPSNVFITRDGQVKLLDFGIAMDMDEPSVREGKVLGTPAYMSPEQAQGRQLDGRSDLYSTGIVAYELCTGERPFKGAGADDILRQHVTKPLPDPLETAPDIPADLVEFIQRATEKSPVDRYLSCAEAADALRAQDDVRATEDGGLASIVVSFPESQRTAVERLLQDMTSRLRLIRGARLLVGHNGEPAPTSTGDNRSDRRKSQVTKVSRPRQP